MVEKVRKPSKETHLKPISVPLFGSIFGSSDGNSLVPRIWLTRIRMVNIAALKY
jgi:hypothetical protein